MVIKKTKETLGQRLRKIARLIETLIDSDIIVYNSLEWRQSLKEKNYFALEINEKGKVLYENL